MSEDSLVEGHSSSSRVLFQDTISTAKYIKMIESFKPKAIKKLANLDKKCLYP